MAWAAEYDITTDFVRPLNPISNTFCAAGELLLLLLLFSVVVCGDCRSNEYIIFQVHTYPTGPWLTQASNSSRLCSVEIVTLGSGGHPVVLTGFKLLLGYLNLL